jgi:cyanobactin biosynthesis protein (PatB/AcyB/McaB family)
VVLLPKQAPPVRRPELAQPHRTVNVTHGTADQLIAMRMRLMHGANFNDPASVAFPAYERMKVSSWTVR